jgi:beta-N-acetylhexosaminidase
LRAVGIDSNCAPTCDVIRPETHPFLKNRCYGTDPLRVAAIARAVAEGMLAEGVLPVVKHMPGHGRATVDSHRDLPRVAAGRADLDASDFAVFRALADLPLGMTAHLVFEALAPEPATCSATMMRLIRDDIGFDGLMMTDDISMQALTGRPADRARAARVAGVDLVLYCNAPLAERVAVAAAAGSMDADGLRRADAALARRIAPASLDIGPFASELEALQGTRGHA